MVVDYGADIYCFRGRSAIVVYDLATQQKVHTLLGDYWKLQADPEKLNTLYAMNHECNRVYFLDLNDNNGSLTERLHINVCTKRRYGCNYFSVAYDRSMLVVNNPYVCAIYDARTGEQIRLLCRKIEDGGSLFCQCLVYQALNQVLLTRQDGGLPEVYCLEEPWVT
jgi:hypothetical protein